MTTAREKPWTGLQRRWSRARRVEAVALVMGPMVAAWVEWLSKTKKDEKATYWERLAKAPWQARVIKMADALDHLNGPLEFQEARLRSARKALALATSAEPAIQCAAAVLVEAINRLEQPSPTEQG